MLHIIIVIFIVRNIQHVVIVLPVLHIIHPFAIVITYGTYFLVFHLPKNCMHCSHIDNNNIRRITTFLHDLLPHSIRQRSTHASCSVRATSGGSGILFIFNFFYIHDVPVGSLWVSLAKSQCWGYHTYSTIMIVVATNVNVMMTSTS